MGACFGSCRRSQLIRTSCNISYGSWSPVTGVAIAYRLRGAEMAKVLYVEDNDDNVFMLTSRLRKNGLDVVVARDGETGVATAVRERPDVIIMDLNLPVLDGWEATRRIKGTEQTKD